MKRIIIILLIMVSPIFAKDIDEAKRFLKLANTQLDADKFDEANASYNRAKLLIGIPTTWDARYWDAASDEFLGKLHLKMGNNALARISYEISLNKFKNLVKMRDGSPDAINEILSKIDEISNSVERIPQNAKNISLDNSKQTGALVLPTDVEKFSCNGCKLKEFPYWLTNYKKLNTIILSNNNIKTIVIPKMPKLTYLDLSANKTKKIDGDFSDIPNLEYLYLSGMNLKSIPPSIIKLSKLNVLDIRGNNIPFSEIKNIIQALPNTLILHDNYILDVQKGEEEEVEE